MGIKVGYKSLPAQSFDTIEDGIYIIEIEDIIEESTKEYGERIVVSHKIVNSSKKINFDNYRINNADGSPHDWGRNKLKVLIDALELTDVEDITVPFLKQLAVGKQIKANIKVNDKGYANINFADLYPMSDPREAINDVAPTLEVAPQNAEAETVSPEVVVAVGEAVDNDDDDI